MVGCALARRVCPGRGQDFPGSRSFSEISEQACPIFFLGKLLTKPAGVSERFSIFFIFGARLVLPKGVGKKLFRWRRRRFFPVLQKMIRESYRACAWDSVA
jgi:hypothetical protein